ncbi:PTS lactose/cellobiose transporter subunit IIA [Clostridium gasigenes]|uniref:PTS lactose/cellobiose transporter subunit IIA n=1 Tax=Clostridium gasigenes TaxID=94869 RepID=A0A1H0VSY6_9CLOT|nr:PTS lactose/cellobiose transporter subunit IIA [Clostridium gasigenes]MBB6622519.1 PTS lactose/cellobiose transporter subunit IIA [Clostridium gasigenes]MBB6714166.1 PTS lactose/cellobiose transporter subunit IIA [Clostridium gasigenes]MBU3088499.1 PTS lactose/cellobiose transporter subunit IIA [Clostridium gasigenes]MBU3103905.1 PTS lactose/cellobiose transporter subunit IIA [Clostridium gasigenes]MBU3108146.1 PTS lactose/cellobiose transporter subunit IIA [Clostridium gasigenes]
MEEIIMNLIMHSGEARSYAMEAMELAKTGDIKGAKELIQKSAEELGEAHHSQTSLIQNEAGGNKTELSLLLVHAQDHLMTTMTLKDVANEIIDIHAAIQAK